MSTKIKAVDDAGKIVTFDSIRAAGRAGFTISRVHKAIYTGQRHRGLKWYLSGKLDALPAFMAATFDLDAPGWTNDTDIYAAFRAALAPDEDLGNGQWDHWEFQQALWRVVSPRTYTKNGDLRGDWRKLSKGERPKPDRPSAGPTSGSQRNADQAAPRPQPSETC